MSSYTIQEWLRDYADSLPLTADREREPNAIRHELLDQFYSKYQDDPVGRFRQFAQAMMFLDEHLDDPRLARGVVPGERQSLVRSSLIRALHQYFAQPTNCVPTVEEIATTADTFRD